MKQQIRARQSLAKCETSLHLKQEFNFHKKSSQSSKFRSMVWVRFYESNLGAEALEEGCEIEGGKELNLLEGGIFFNSNPPLSKLRAKKCIRKNKIGFLPINYVLEYSLKIFFF